VTRQRLSACLFFFETVLVGPSLIALSSSRVISVMGYETLGMVAGVFTTFAFAPQAYAVYRTKSTRDISLIMYIVLCTGIILWVIYGILNDALSVWLWNGITLILAFSIMAMKVYWERIKKPEPTVKTIDATHTPEDSSNGHSHELPPSNVIEMASDHEVPSDTEKPTDSESEKAN